MSYSKTLKPFVKLYLQKYVQKKYPIWVQFIESVIGFIEETNSLSWFENSATLQKENSIYHNIENFFKFFNVEDLPIENEDILNAYINDYCRTLDLRSSVLSFDSSRILRMMKYNTLILNTKSSWKMYNFIVSIFNEYYLQNTKESIEFRSRFRNDYGFPVSQAPDFFYKMIVSSVSSLKYGDVLEGASSGAFGTVKYIDSTTNTIYLDEVTKAYTLSENLELNSVVVATVSSLLTTSYSNYLNNETIILSELPTYELQLENNSDLFIDRTDILAGQQGTKPFHYQIVSKSNILLSGDFSKRMRDATSPAGFRCETIYIAKDLNDDFYRDSKVFPKLTFDIDSII